MIEHIHVILVLTWLIAYNFLKTKKKWSFIRIMNPQTMTTAGYALCTNKIYKLNHNKTIEDYFSFFISWSHFNRLLS